MDDPVPIGAAPAGSGRLQLRELRPMLGRNLLRLFEQGVRVPAGSVRLYSHHPNIILPRCAPGVFN